MRLEKEGEECHRSCGKGNVSSRPACLRDRGKRLLKVNSLG